jgi:amino acid transporter
MIRTLVGVLGAISALFPDQIVGIFEKLAIANPSEGTVRGWVRPAIRSEGVLIFAISLRNGRAYAWLMNLTGVFGAIVLLFPDLYQRFATAFMYERLESIEWNERFRSGIRAIGALYVFLAAKTYRERHNDT